MDVYSLEKEMSQIPLLDHRIGDVYARLVPLTLTAFFKFVLSQPMCTEVTQLSPTYEDYSNY